MRVDWEHVPACDYLMPSMTSGVCSSTAYPTMSRFR